MAPSKNSAFVQYTAWTLSLIVACVAVVAWGQDLQWQLSSLTAYSFFPLLGLLAFSLMWTHYVVGALRLWLGVDKTVVKNFFAGTGWIVLLLVCLHPGLLWFQLFRDGFGLPPLSYLNHYVAPSLGWVALLGTASLLCFLAFEFKRWFGKKSWWPIVEYANVAAMFAILVHSLKLGSNLQVGWLRSVWLVYGVTLAMSVIYIYYCKWHNKQVPKDIKA